MSMSVAETAELVIANPDDEWGPPLFDGAPGEVSGLRPGRYRGWVEDAAHGHGGAVVVVVDEEGRVTF